MKTLFLDFDGVLNSRDFILQKGRGDVISSAMVERLNTIVDATGCKIVISSTWRIFHPIAVLRMILRQHGLRNGDEVVIGITPELLSEEFSRTDEIRAWLKDHPEVTQFVAIDDDQLFGLEANFVHTSFKHGLQDDHVTQAINILNKV